MPFISGRVGRREDLRIGAKVKAEGVMRGFVNAVRIEEAEEDNTEGEGEGETEEGESTVNSIGEVGEVEGEDKDKEGVVTDEKELGVEGETGEMLIIDVGSLQGCSFPKSLKNFFGSGVGICGLSSSSSSMIIMFFSSMLIYSERIKKN